MSGTFTLAALSAEPIAASAYSMTAGRLAATTAGLIGLAGLVVGGLALARARRRNGDPRRGAFTAVTAGLISILVGGLVVATADGGLGTGNGLGGGFVALIIGLIDVTLGAVALTRSRRSTSTPGERLSH